MIQVPQSVLEALAASFGTASAHLSHFGGGEESSDGIVYAYPYQDARRLLKIMAIPADDRRGGLLRLEERLAFVLFLGERGAHIVFPQFSPGGNLYETFLDENYLWVGYSMDLVPGRIRAEKTWDPDFFRKWGETIGQLHRLAQGYPSWEASVDVETGEEHLAWRGEWEGFYHWLQDDEVVPADQVYRFLGKAMRQVAEDRPFRGPSSFEEQDLTYSDESEGTVEGFKGIERILHRGREIYRLHYHGGLVESREIGENDG
ncbi:MAG TPA: hypothetical protein ENN19_05290 [Chloroflexi bacterium]|nr:hypothetical protein [Chloroflexota bacterium]